MRRTVGIAVALLAFAAPGPAFGKGTERLQTFPTSPRAGRVTTLQLRAYDLQAGSYRPTLAPGKSEWHLVVFSPSNRSFGLDLVRSRRDPYVWTVSFRFRSPGRWWISLADDPGVRTLEVRVRHRLPTVWDRLERPLHVPTVLLGSQCPAAAPNGNLAAKLGWGLDLPAFGPGPGYPFLRDQRARAVVFFDYLGPAGWGNAKVM